jgi:hypothetical protein
VWLAVFRGKPRLADGISIARRFSLSFLSAPAIPDLTERSQQFRVEIIRALLARRHEKDVRWETKPLRAREWRAEYGPANSWMTEISVAFLGMVGSKGMVPAVG